MDHLDYLTQTQSTKISSAFYVYDENKINQSFELFHSINYSKTNIFFASMANDNLELLRMVRAQGFGIFVNSLKHLKIADQCGFPSDKIIFASTGLTEQMMQHLIARKITLHLDSVAQIELYGKLNPGSNVGLRLNTSERSRNSPFTGNESRIGIQHSEIETALAACAKHDLVAVGAHVYIGTDIVSVDEMMEGVNRTLNLCDAFSNLEYVDFGGGFPLDRSQFDFNTYNQRISQVMLDYSIARGRIIKMILEPGRAMFGDSACFYARVTDVKRRDGCYFVCVDGSASLLPRALFYEDFNPVQLASNNANSSERTLFDQPVDIVGNTTYSRDFLARKIQLPEVKVNEWLEFSHAGSYCYSMITRFLGQTYPPEYLLGTGGNLKLIRKHDCGEEALQ